MTTAFMNAAAIANALEAHFVDPKDSTSGVVLREVQAPNSTRRIDVLAVSLWASRGYGIDAVEIKTSRSDYQLEIATPAKADPWWRCSNRFWIAAPSTDVADPALLPPGWGLLVPGKGRRFKTVVKPLERQVEPTMALLTTILGRAVNTADQRTRIAVDRVRDDEHTKRAEREKALRDELMAAADPEVRRALDKIRTVEAHAGVAIDQWGVGLNSCSPAAFGTAVRRALDLLRAEEDTGRVIARTLQDMRAQAERIRKAADELEKANATGQ